MNRNHEIADQFDEIADRQLLLGESWFKIRAYRRAAETMRATSEDVAALSAAARLSELDAVGEAITEKTAEYLGTGHISLLDRLRGQTAGGELALLRAGLTPTQVRELRAVGVSSPDALREGLSRGGLSLSKRTLAAAKEAVSSFAANG
jgi:DNA polymerase (family X)